jgi:predicted membrane chloride channel (bestrophin family)
MEQINERASFLRPLVAASYQQPNDGLTSVSDAPYPDLLIPPPPRTTATTANGTGTRTSSPVRRARTGSITSNNSGGGGGGGGVDVRRNHHRRFRTTDLRKILTHFGSSGGGSFDRLLPDGASPHHFLNRAASEDASVDEEMEEGERFVRYHTESHTSVMFQMHGSVWPRVLPYCVANTVLFWIVVFVDRSVTASISVAPTAHSLTALLLSFLVVQRSRIVYDRFMNARHALEDMNRICTELVQMVCIYSKHDTSVEAQNWRSRCAFTTILLLRTTVAALEYRNTKMNAWDILLDKQASDQAFMTETQAAQAQQQQASHGSAESASSSSAPAAENENDADFLKDAFTAMEQDRTGHLFIQRWAHGKRSVFHRNFRAPSVLAYRLRDCILSNRQKVCHPQKMQLLEELQLTTMITQYVTEFHKLKADISQPFPFPLAQMARTFLFVWVFSLPFCIAHDIRNVVLGSFLVFFATYGFVGMELVSIEMDDPYGDDPNDFDDVAFAQMTFEDIYITILKTDGLKRATKLRATVKDLAKRTVQRVHVLQVEMEMEAQQQQEQQQQSSSPFRQPMLQQRTSLPFGNANGTHMISPIHRSTHSRPAEELLAENTSVLGIF